MVSRWDEGFNSRHLEEIEITPLSDREVIAQCRNEVKQCVDAGFAAPFISSG